jgi:hypothetical protein
MCQFLKVMQLETIKNAVTIIIITAFTLMNDLETQIKPQN